MFHHTVLFRWQDGVGGDAVRALTDALRALPSVLPCIRSYAVGPDLGLSGDQAWDFAVTASFDDKAAWDEYMADPEHDRIRSDLLRPILAERAVVQFEG